MLSGMSVAAWVAGCVLQVCEADEKLATDSIRRCHSSARRDSEKNGKKS
jgi:hypothetical protein